MIRVPECSDSGEGSLLGYKFLTSHFILKWREGLAHGEASSMTGSAVKDSLAIQDTQEMQVQSPGREDALEEETAAHCSILAWKVPWSEESGGLLAHRVAKSGTWLSEHTLL